MESYGMCRAKTYGLVQRILHWWIGVTVAALVGLGWAEKFLEAGSLRISMTHMHIVLGYALGIGLTGRLAWAAMGPPQARLKSLGHDQNSRIAYLGLYALLSGAVGTGLLLAAMRYDRGPLADKIFDELTWHEWTFTLHNYVLYGATLFMFAHLIGMIRHEKKRGIPVAQAMVSGYRYRRVDTEES